MQTNQRSLVTVMALFAIDVYRNIFSANMLHTCMFVPTCSVYAKNAIQRYGAIKGIVLACGRLGRCHPWTSFGYDPVN